MSPIAKHHSTAPSDLGTREEIVIRMDPSRQRDTSPRTEAVPQIAGTIPIGAPRPMRPRVTTLTAGLLARGSPPCAAFPGLSSGLVGARLSAYSCGGSRGFGPA